MVDKKKDRGCYSPRSFKHRLWLYVFIPHTTDEGVAECGITGDPVKGGEKSCFKSHHHSITPPFE